jgi:tetratricopeptide (TPR) repeat protein
LFYQNYDGLSSGASKQPLTVDLHRREWVDRSLNYYTKVMREERRRTLGQAVDYDTAEYQDTFTALAKKHYFALRKIKTGQWRHAETIYRRIISELVQDDECNHAQLAVTTLLLALLLQRMGLRKETRSVFLHFFRVAVLDQEEDEECACSAKVLQAYALFEMKQGNSLKSLELVKRAVQLDPSLEPVLSWKQFRDVLERKSR